MIANKERISSNDLKDLKEYTVKAKSCLNHIIEKVESLEKIVKVELQPRIHRLETIIKALNRDVDEMADGHGPVPEKVKKLAREVKAELSNLAHDVEALDHGNPTTISAALDAAGRLFERIRFRHHP